MREPSRTEAATLTHTCGLVDILLIVRMVKMENNPLMCCVGEGGNLGNLRGHEVATVLTLADSHST